MCECVNRYTHLKAVFIQRRVFCQERCDQRSKSTLSGTKYQLFTHHVSRSHQLRLYAIVPSWAIGTEIRYCVDVSPVMDTDGCVAVGTGKCAMSLSRRCRPDREHVLGDRGTNNGAQAAAAVVDAATVSSRKNEKILRILGRVKIHGRDRAGMNPNKFTCWGKRWQFSAHARYK